MSEFVLHPEAVKDLDEIWEYIAAGGPFKPGFGLSGQLRVPHSIPFRNRVATTCENPATNGTLNMLAVESRSHPGRFWA